MRKKGKNNMPSLVEILKEIRWGMIKSQVHNAFKDIIFMYPEPK